MYVQAVDILKTIYDIRDRVPIDYPEFKVGGVFLAYEAGLIRMSKVQRARWFRTLETEEAISRMRTHA